MRRCRRCLIGGGATLIAAVAAVGLLVIRPARATSTSSPIVVDVGDLVQIAGTHVSCGVVQRAGAKVIQCLAPQPLARTYGTLMGDKKVLVVRFRNNTTAKVVFTAIQKRTFSTCK
jgi:hypothetical protein